MDFSLLLTVFLILGGAIPLWCSIKNYDWYFAHVGKSGVLIQVLGRKIARGFFILVGLVMVGWGLFRVVKPPEKIPVTFIAELAKPEGINLASPKEAAESLAKIASVKDLVIDDDGWVSFSTTVPPDSPLYSPAAKSTVAASDFSEGFTYKKRKVGTNTMEGRIIYLNESYESCDHMIFSKRPLKSAVLVMVICTPKRSKEKLAEDGGLAVYFFRAGTEVYREVTRF